MPWSCPECGATVEIDVAHCDCGHAKSAWSFVVDQTREMVVARKRFECLRGADPAPLEAEGEYARDGWAPTDAAPALRKREARALAAAGRRPAPSDLLTVRVYPGKGSDRAVRLGVHFARRAIQEREFACEEVPLEDEALDARFLLVCGPEELGEETAFAGIELLDVSEEGAPGYAGKLEVTSVKRRPQLLRIVPADWRAVVRVRVVGPDGAPLTGAEASLSGPPLPEPLSAATDADGRVEFRAVPLQHLTLSVAGGDHRVPATDARSSFVYDLHLAGAPAADPGPDYDGGARRLLAGLTRVQPWSWEGNGDV